MKRLLRVLLWLYKWTRPAVGNIRNHLSLPPSIVLNNLSLPTSTVLNHLVFCNTKWRTRNPISACLTSLSMRSCPKFMQPTSTIRKSWMLLLFSPWPRTPSTVPPVLWIKLCRYSTTLILLNIYIYIYIDEI